MNKRDYLHYHLQEVYDLLCKSNSTENDESKIEQNDDLKERVRGIQTALFAPLGHIKKWSPLVSQPTSAGFFV